MKKLAAILLLALFLFNTIGYRLLFDFIQTSTDEAFTAKLDEGKYDEKDLIAVKVPVNMPYQVNRTGFERVDGEINVDGKVYKYVKRSVRNDTITLFCIPHYEKTALQQKASELAGKINDLPSNDNSRKAEVFKQLTVDFDIIYATAMYGNEKALTVSGQSENFYPLPQQFLPVNGQPPEFTA
ncbi:MAG: hypothetical protein ABI861_03335 [Panacibacter sp.]